MTRDAGIFDLFEKQTDGGFHLTVYGIPQIRCTAYSKVSSLFMRLPCPSPSGKHPDKLIPRMAPLQFQAGSNLQTFQQVAAGNVPQVGHPLRFDVGQRKMNITKVFAFILFSVANGLFGGNLIFDLIDEIDPSPFILNQELYEQFLSRTGYESKILVSNACVFTSGDTIGCVFSCSAIVIHEGSDCVDHGNFVAVRSNSEGWKKMDLYRVSSNYTSPLQGEVDSDLFQRIIDDYGLSVSPEMILEGVRALGGE